MPRAYIGLGANLGYPPGQIQAALTHIGARARVRLVAQSSLYRSAPLGPPGQPDYCNAACAVDTDLAPDDLLTALHGIERDMGRKRPPLRWAPRLIDLDLLHVEGIRVRTERLVLPHPEIARRNFVLAPLAEIVPGLVIPDVGKVSDLARAIGDAGLQRWTDNPVDAT